MKYDGYIFDVDGVLVNTNESFTSAVLEAVSYATSSHNFGKMEFGQLKTVPGFNNDCYVAIAGASWINWRQEMDFSSFVLAIEDNGGGIKGLRKFIKRLNPEFEEMLIRLFQESYGGTLACHRLYGFKPEFILHEGFWRKEIPLVSFNLIKPFITQSGIFTGRNFSEMELAFELLGWTLPNSVVAVSETPELDKPNPTKIIHIIEKLNCNYPVYLGDTRDDLELVKNYRLQTGGKMDFCLIESHYKINDYDLTMPSAEFMLNTMEQKNEYY
tara:strand:- start:9044 stop:9856 length:813 start_codon:yes stop_codon:yes gene_type:complete